MLYRLLTWFSPSYPVGAYTFSHGLENAVEVGLVHSMGDALRWISDLITFGNGQTDLVFVRCAWERAHDPVALREVQDLAVAFSPSAELRLETMSQGTAFLKITSAVWSKNPGLTAPCAYPVAVGAFAALHEIEKKAVMLAYGHAFAANLVSACVRLVPLGQTDGQRIIAELERTVEEAVEKAISTSLERLATSTLRADITSMQHEAQYTRLFRS